MKNTWMLAILAILIAISAFAPGLAAASPAYGAAGAAAVADSELTLGAMLTFALQDEYLARGEYQKIMATFGERRPFSNIVKAEEQHIAWLVPLFEKYGVKLPPDRGQELAQVPETFSAALLAGVDAEIANIDMYQRFLSRELPSDVRAVFDHLLTGSRNHLAAFQGGRGGGKNR
jgi:hypothetical protein